MNENGLVVEDTGLTAPAPFSVIVTLVALPPNVLPLTVTGLIPHIELLLLLKVTVGGFAHPQATWKLDPVVVHPEAFFTVIEWVPLATFEKETPVWKVLPSRLYVSPVPVGLVTLITALPEPSVQSTVWTGLAGESGGAGITTFEDALEVHPVAAVTENVYVPAGIPEIVVLVPEPVVITAPGVRVRVQMPLAGRPLSATLPVAIAQVGLVIVPTTGAAGMAFTVIV